MQKDAQEDNVVVKEEQLSTKVQLKVQQATKGVDNGKSTTKGDGNGTLWSGSKEKMCNPRQSYIFGKRY